MWEDIQIFLPDQEWRGQEQELGVYDREYGDEWLTRVSPSTSLPSALTNWMSWHSVYVINEKLVIPESSPHPSNSTTDEIQNEIMLELLFATHQPGNFSSGRFQTIKSLTKALSRSVSLVRSAYRELVSPKAGILAMLINKDIRKTNPDVAFTVMNLDRIVWVN